jgi:hypothetical protein
MITLLSIVFFSCYYLCICHFLKHKQINYEISSFLDSQCNLIRSTIITNNGKMESRHLSDDCNVQIRDDAKLKQCFSTYKY